MGGGGLEAAHLVVNGNSVDYTTYTIDGVYNMKLRQPGKHQYSAGSRRNCGVLGPKDSYSAKYGFAVQAGV